MKITVEYQERALRINWYRWRSLLDLVGVAVTANNE
jgi:hypothetical protein